jgi:alpha-glucoside transport system permease protein
MALAFLAPALVFLGAIVVYPTIDTIAQSFQSDQARDFVGFENYKEIFTNDRIVTAIKNNAIWVATAPAIITGLGLMFALLTERVRYATALKLIVFMPMAISFLATGIIWRVMYESSPDRGLVNAVIGTVSDAVSGAGAYPSATFLPDEPYVKEPGGAIASDRTYLAGESAFIGLVAIGEEAIPAEATQAVEAATQPDALAVTVWRDFKPGGGEAGVVEEGELGLPGTTVEVVDASGDVVASGATRGNGTVVIEDLGDGPFTVRAAAQNFETGFAGIGWLTPSLITPALIGAFSWMWAGFAVVVIGAGLAALPRDVLEAARVDGANEWQTFRYVTLPLLAPVLGVVFVTLVINVLKIFDIVLVLAPGASQDDANVIALEMYKTSFTAQRYGVGSAVAVLLFVLVIPIMILNLKRFRRES